MPKGAITRDSQRSNASSTINNDKTRKNGFHNDLTDENGKVNASVSSSKHVKERGKKVNSNIN